MRLLLIGLAVFCSFSSFAMPTITVPDLVVEQQLTTEVQDLDNPVLNKTVLQTMPKFTADLRGALIKSGQFKIINLKTMPDSIAYVNINSNESSHTLESKAIESNLIGSELAIESNLAESTLTPLFKQQQINPSTEYYLIGSISYIGENEDSYPIKQTNNITKQYVVEVAANFKLIRSKDKVIMASFSATGRANDVKIISTENKYDRTWHHNVGKLVSKASKMLAKNTLTELETQFNFTLQNEEKEKKANEPIVVTDVKEYH